jgi:hypothetical protein
MKSKASAASREFQRYSTYSELRVNCEGSDDEIPVRAPDVSVRGMFINTTGLFPEGAVMKISFRLTRSGFEVKARAEVRYCLPGVGIGVEFTDISAEAQRMIEQEHEYRPNSTEPCA